MGGGGRKKEWPQIPERGGGRTLVPGGLSVDATAATQINT